MLKKTRKMIKITKIMIEYTQKMDWKGNILSIVLMNREYNIYYSNDIPPAGVEILSFDPKKKQSLYKIIYYVVKFQLKNKLKGGKHV